MASVSNQDLSLDKTDKLVCLKSGMMSVTLAANGLKIGASLAVPLIPLTPKI